MPRLHLVRHGEAAAGWDADRDPGLSPLGRAQARAVAASLSPLGPLPVLASPLRRCLETAEPLVACWGVELAVEPRVAEIPSPSVDLGARSAWLRDLMRGTWTAAAPELDSWREELVGCLLEVATDAVVFTHFIAINVVVGRALRDDRVVCRRVENCSITVLDVSASGELRLLGAGAESETEVL